MIGAKDWTATLYQRSGAAVWGIPVASFCGLLWRIADRDLPLGHSDRERRKFLESLQLEDLALAHACAEGTAAAWDRFFQRYQPMLHAAALLLCHDEAAAEEMVGLLIGDLYGSALGRDGRRRSKLAAYSGRGTLAAWLRATLGQMCIDRHRAARRYTTLEDALPQLCGGDVPDAGRWIDARLAPAVEDLLRELPAESRLLLKAHYLDGMTFAEIGRLLGLHESSVSRRTNRLVAFLRRSLLRRLQQRGMSVAAARQALSSDVRRIGADIEGTLLQRMEEV